MELSLITISGGKSEQTPGKTIELRDETFGVAYNESLVHQVVCAYLSGGRAGTRAHKSRSMVRGGGAKPWRQKGTGRARAGTLRSPLWRGGGKTFAAQPKDYTQKINKKMYRKALCSILGEILRQGRLVVVSEIKTNGPKTKALVLQLQALGLDNVLIVTDHASDELYLSARNIPNVAVCDARAIDPVSLIRPEKVLITVSGIKQIEELLA